MSSRQASKPKPSVRLLWDELLSPLVPQALRVLGYRTSFIGNEADGQPPRSSTDAEIMAHAQRTNQIIVTSNHDMMLICAEAGQRFVWIDPHRRQLTRAHQVLLVLEQIDQWQELLDAHPAKCVRAMRTKCVAIDPEEASRLAALRMRALARRRRAKATKVQSDGRLFSGAQEDEL